MRADDNGPTYPVAQRLDVGVSKVEDRIAVVAHTAEHGTRAAWLTRRLLRQLLGSYAGVLEQTSQTAARTPPAYRDDVLQMEHVTALASEAGTSDASGEDGGG
mgnify:CR=1 FL=1